jgi:hypothetical protein
MKQIKWPRFIILFLIMANHAKALISAEEKLEFSRFYRNQIDLLKIYPDRPEVKVIFTDLDGDNKEEAIATSYEGFYETGWLWSSYKKTNGKWMAIKRHDDGKLASNSKAIYARPGEIFKITKEDGGVEFLILNQNFDNQSPDGKGTLIKTRFWIDEKGLMQEATVADIDKYLAFRTMMGGLIQNLEVLKVEMFKD